MPGGCEMRADHTGSYPRNTPIQEELGKGNEDSLSRSPHWGRYRKQDTSSRSSNVVNMHLVSGKWNTKGLEAMS